MATFRRYVPRQGLEQANAPHPPPDGGLAEGKGLPPQRESIALLPSREVKIELEPGVWELPPSLVGWPLLLTFGSRVRRASPPVIVVRKPPRLNTRFEKTIIFAPFSAHFDHPAQAERELAGILKVMRQFPQLRVTIEGNFCINVTPPDTRGFGPRARADQDKRFDSPQVTRWPNETESYFSNGQLMDNRAQTIRQFLTRNGIAASRITARRGQYTVGQRSVTIIFFN